MLREFAEYLARVAKPEVQEINGRTYVDKGVTLVRTPIAKSLALSTLDGLVNYLTVNIDCNNAMEPFIVVESPTKVCLYTPLNNDNDRECLIEVKAITPNVDFRYKDQEEFCISLKSDFVQTSVTDEVLRIIGTIEERAVKQSGDDGFSQSVTVKKDIVSKAVETVPSVVELAPYRTFSEVEQPSSEFILRLKEGPRAALFEADGGAWRNDAIENIKNYLEEKLPQVNVLA